MKLWPADTFDIETTLSPHELAAALAAHVEPWRWYRFSWKHAPFQGEVSPAGFRITRIIHYRNSFLPRVEGVFLPLPGGTKLQVRMNLHPLVIGFLVVWCSIAAMFLVAFAVAAVTNDVPVFLPFVLALMLPLAWAMAAGSFWWEAATQKRLLIKLVKQAETAAQPILATHPRANGV